MGYINFLLVSTMKKLDLFDNISYKYIKDIINDDDDDIEVEIKDLDCDRFGYCKTRFTFSIPQLIDERFGEKYYKDAKFVVEKEYNGSSAFALMMCELDTDDERLTDEEEDKTDTEDSSTDEEEDEMCMYNGTIASKKAIEYLYRDEIALQKILDTLPNLKKMLSQEH